jgi:hypothetical protein
MIRLNAVALAFAVMSAVPGMSAAQGGIDGVWEVSLETPQGPMTVEATLKQDGEVVTGQLVSPMGSLEIKGKLVADALSFAYSVPVQDQTIEITMTGKVAGDAMSGSINFAGLGEATWTAKRKAAAPAATAAATPAPADASVASAAGGAGGKWDIVLRLGGAGEFPMTGNFTQEGDKVTGTLSSQAGDVPVTGTMVGSALKLEFTAPTPNGDITITMTGDLGADGFAGKAGIAGLGEADWTGKRAK